ncbi:MAG TPA: EfeM/EfeO family lipoprotein [Acidimicrobiales bacterium]|nr:EfeM/EfeO family lipoprotein [Acidimicrobiales bacterium]
MAPVARQLLVDVTTLREKMTDVSLEPAMIANGAVELLDDVSRTKITGEEERYSYIDLVDLRANVDGSKAAFEAVEPMVAARQPSLASQIGARVAAVDALLATYKSGPGTYDYASYETLRPADTRAISAAVDALAEPLSQVSRIVVS